MKHILKNLIKIAAVGAFLFTTAPLLSCVVFGYIAYKGVDVIGSILDAVKRFRMGARLAVDENVAKMNDAVHKANVRVKNFDVLSGHWDIKSLPLDMFPTIGTCDRRAFFSCAGIPNVVEGRFLGRDFFGRHRYEFSMIISDPVKAQEVSEYVAEKGILGITVTRTNDDRFRILSDNAVDINTIVKEFYPPRTMEVRRDISTVKQYIVPDCSSYEEALQKFKADRHKFSPENIYYKSKDTVDGHSDHESVSGCPLSVSSLRVGEYVINATSIDVYSKNVTFNGGIDQTDAALRSEASENFDCEYDDRIEDLCTSEPELSDALDGMNVSRFMELVGETVRLVSADQVMSISEDANIVLRFNSVDELLSVATGDRPISGNMVLLEGRCPEADRNELLLTVPLDADLLSSMRMRNGDPENLYQQYKNTGVSIADIHSSCITNELLRRGYATVELNDQPDFSGAKINGVPMSDFLERIGDLVEDGCREQLRDRQQTQDWLYDASRILSVNMHLDIKNMKLVLSSCVKQDGGGSVTNVIERKLSEEETLMMASRSRSSDSELKDLLIMSQPSIFETYSHNGKGIYKDPIGDFIQGRRPVLVDQGLDASKKVHSQKNEQKDRARSAGKKRGMSI